MTAMFDSGASQEVKKGEINREKAAGKEKGKGHR